MIKITSTDPNSKDYWGKKHLEKNYNLYNNTKQKKEDENATKELIEFIDTKNKTIDSFIKDKMKVNKLKKQEENITNEITELKQKQNEIESKEYMFTSITRTKEKISETNKLLDENKKELKEALDKEYHHGHIIYGEHIENEEKYPLFEKRDYLKEQKRLLSERLYTLQDTLEHILEEEKGTNSLLGIYAELQENLYEKTKEKVLLQLEITKEQEKLRDETCLHEIVAVFSDEYVCLECGKHGKLTNTNQKEALNNTDRELIQLNTLYNLPEDNFLKYVLGRKTEKFKEESETIINILSSKCNTLRGQGYSKDQIIDEFNKIINLDENEDEIPKTLKQYIKNKDRLLT